MTAAVNLESELLRVQTSSVCLRDNSDVLANESHVTERYKQEVFRSNALRPRESENLQ